jgi:hypothetical protein
MIERVNDAVSGIWNRICDIWDDMRDGLDAIWGCPHR